MIKNIGHQNNALLAEIIRHKTCIDNLRGYIDFLEKEAANLKAEMNHEN